MASRAGLALLRNARQGDAQAQLALGRVYLTGEHGLGKSLITAYHWLEMAARAGVAEAWEALGREIPLVELKDPASALQWYRRAAASGIAAAQREVGAWLLGRDPAPDTSREALTWLERAAAQGDVASQLLLGRLYLAGRHVPKDTAAARVWLEQAARQGSMESHRELLRICTSLGDLPGIERHARPLAERGDVHASYALGMALLGRAPAPIS